MRHFGLNIILCVSRDIYYEKLECGLANRDGAINRYAVSCDVSVSLK